MSGSATLPQTVKLTTGSGIKVTGLSFVATKREETAAATATVTTTAATCAAVVLAEPDSPPDDPPGAIAPAPALTPEAHDVAALCDAAIAI
jgi:hypothetical protein